MVRHYGKGLPTDTLAYADLVLMDTARYTAGETGADIIVQNVAAANETIQDAVSVTFADGTTEEFANMTIIEVRVHGPEPDDNPDLEDY